MVCRTSLVALSLVIAADLDPASAQQTVARTELVSVGPNHVVGNLPSDLFVDITPDGWCVLFSSYATNLAPPDTNGDGTYSHGLDVFLRDRRAMTVERLSLGIAGAEPDENCTAGGMTPDARYVVFTSEASNLVAGDGPLSEDVFLVDRTLGTLELVSRTAAGGFAGAESEAIPSCISADGRYVVFTSMSPQLTSPPAPYYYHQVYRRDRVAGVTELVSVTSTGGWPLGDSTEATISADGRLVCFLSDDASLVAGDTNGFQDVFVRDMQAGTTQRVSLRFNGNQLIYDSKSPRISADGSTVIFTTYAPNVVSYPVPLSEHAYVRDLAAGTNELVSVGDQGQPAAAHSFHPAISANGRFAVFDNLDGSLTYDSDASWYDVFRRDRLTATTLRVSIPWNTTQSDAQCEFASVASDGTVAFWAAADNLVPADTNVYPDIAVRSWATGDIVTICHGDGLSKSCPCNNAGVTGRGCASSFNPQGARLTGAGSPSVTHDTLVLSASGMLNNYVLYLQGSAASNAGYGQNYGDGLLCVTSSLVRLKVVLNSGGASQYPGPGDSPISVRGGIPAGGGVTRVYQVVYRDPASFCTAFTLNATDAVSVLWNP